LCASSWHPDLRAEFLELRGQLVSDPAGPFSSAGRGGGGFRTAQERGFGCDRVSRRDCHDGNVFPEGLRLFVRRTIVPHRERRVRRGGGYLQFVPAGNCASGRSRYCVLEGVCIRI